MNLPPFLSACSSLRGRRPHNEDAVLDARLPDGRHLVAVADGMGGHRGGRVASATALKALYGELQAGRRLREAVVAANAAVHELAERDPACSGMGTTVVALLREGAVYEIANVGDSRAYRVDDRGIAQMTVDHSFAAEALRTGAYSLEEIARSPWRNALTRSVGTQPAVEVDLFGPFEIAGPPHFVALCSDGFYRTVPDRVLRERLLGGGALDDAVSELANLALANGSDDNVSVAVVEIGRPLHRAGATIGPARAGVAAGTSRAPAMLLAAQPMTAIRAVRLAPRPAPRHRLVGPVRRLVRRIASESVLFVLCSCLLAAWIVMNLLGG